MRKNRQSIIQINNTKDVMCMARAVVVAKCNADKEESVLEEELAHYEKIRSTYADQRSHEVIGLSEDFSY